MVYVFALLFLVALVLMIIGIANPNKSLFWYNGKKTRTKSFLYYFSATFIFFIMIGVTAPDRKKKDQVSDIKESKVKNEASINTSTNVSDVKSELLLEENLKVVDNYYFLIDTKDLSKENIEKIASDLKSKNCSRECNILLFDERKAFELYLEDSNGKIKIEDYNYDKEAFNKALNDWQEKNYVYLADHTIGSIDFSSNHFDYYPFKDWRYKELKNK